MKRFLSIVAGILAVACLLTGFAQAATYTNAVGDTEGYPAFVKGKVYTLTGTIDLSERTYTTNDVVELIRVPSNTLVTAVACRWTTAPTLTGPADLTFDVGDGSSTAGYLSNVTTSLTAQATAVAFATTMTLQTVTTYGTNSTTAILAVTNATASTAASPAYTDGRFYTAADTIDVKFDAFNPAYVTGVLKVWAVLFDLN